MLRIVPKEESEFNERCKRAVWDFIMAEGLNWKIATKMSEDQIWMLCDTLWYVKQKSIPEEDDIMNSREKRKEWEKLVKESENKND